MVHALRRARPRQDKAEHRYRIICMQRPRAPWRATKAEAQQDAIDLGLASRDPWSDAVYLDALAWIEKSFPTRETERDLRGRDMPSRELAQVADLKAFHLEGTDLDQPAADHGDELTERRLNQRRSC